MKHCSFILLLATTSLMAQEPRWQGKFEQLEQMLPTPNEYRSGSGAPGPRYWQQQADYVIHAELNDDTQTMTGSEVITYYNNSPDVLTYLWLQLDQNLHAQDNDTDKTSTGSLRDSSSVKAMAGQLNMWDMGAGYKITLVADEGGKPLPYTINKTMMRVELPKPVKKGEKFGLKVEWSFKIVDRNLSFSRGGYEYFPEDGNYSYTVAQWFPRLCVYDDVAGWQNKQFLGHSEFALPFGNYKVNLTVPSDHIVAGTGTVQNLNEVLTSSQYQRFQQAQKSFDKPVIICTQAEAAAREKSKSKEKKTWKFTANNVRDFAFATSRKYIWDAMAVKVGSYTPMAMSYYPKEGNPLWEKESTLAVKNTLEVYSKYTVDFSYPQATSVHAASIGMEYPMICFNFGRPAKDGSYTKDVAKRMIGVIVHEVGHNFFPMIINSDERQWTWMDEGLNSFVQLLTELERYPDYDWDRGKPKGAVDYMKSDKTTMRPIMTGGEQVIQLGAEQYMKVAAGLYLLRQTVMEPKLFDMALKEYAQRWAFRHPRPADFFRTMEDASAVDLDWFWRGWFYSTDNVDISLDNVRWFRVKAEAKNIENKNVTADAKPGTDLSAPNYFNIIPTDPRFYGEFANRINDAEVMNKMKDKNFYELTLTNKGGLVMPVIIQWKYKDGSTEIEKIPAEIWRNNEQKVTKVFAKDKEVAAVTIDPKEETSDIDVVNNTFPREKQVSKFEEFKEKQKKK